LVIQKLELQVLSYRINAFKREYFNLSSIYKKQTFNLLKISD
jgi:hypothetical protein